MTEKEILAKFEEAKKDTEFMKMLGEQDTPEKIQAAFATKGIELSLDEVKELVVKVVDTSEENQEELNEDALDNVSGGFIGMGIALGLTALGVAVGWRTARHKC